MKSTSLLRNVLDLTIIFLLLLLTASCAAVPPGKSSLVGDWSFVGAATETYRDGMLVSKEEGAPEKPDNVFLFSKDGRVFHSHRIGAWDFADNRLMINYGSEKHQCYELLSISRSSMIIRWEYQPNGDEPSDYRTYIIGEYAR